ncbi:MAG: DUF3592 domain-containing protein [Opitutales bacterium]|nr:DUF3592 domain-containing protein [Opitutales bacterium]MCH8541728.1 DUF3592 domain-containing protein [Opitutales bacterium]
MNTPSRGQKKLIAAFCGIIGLGIMLWKTSQVVSTHLTSNWPQTEAEIVNLRSYQSVTSSSNGRTSTSYMFEITYEYEVDGHTYEGENYFRNRPYSTGIRRHRDDLVAELRSEEKLTIYYNPNDPTDAFAVVTSREDIWVGFLIGSCFLGFGLLILFSKNQSPYHFPHPPTFR